MKILHLYHDLMNLYGDYANITALTKLLSANGITAKTDRLSIGDEVDFDSYDFIFIGSGTERNLRVMLNDLRRHSAALTKYIGSEKVMLMTGNSFEALGKTLTDSAGNTVEGLGLFDFDTVEQNKERLVGDIVFDCGFLSSPVVGFVNKCSEINGINEPMFTVRMGLGNRRGDSGEGIRMNNLFCTHVTGPVLVKNPHFLLSIAGLICSKSLSDDALEYEKKGYAVTLSELKKRMEA